MSCCNCGQPKKLCRCPKKSTETPEAPQRAYIAECTDCDPCRPCESMVKICSFVTPTLTEGQRFRNSFVYNQEDDSVYYISDDGTPTRFGSSPMFINNFNPEDKAIPRQTVFDFANNKAYIFNPEGEYVTVDLAGAKSEPVHLEISYPELSRWATISTSGVFDIYGTEDATFTRSDNGTTMTVEQVYAALENGEEFIFDKVPFGIGATAAGAREVYPEVLGATVKTKQQLSIAGEGVIDGFVGLEPITILTPSAGSMLQEVMPLSFGIVKARFDEDTVVYTFEVQTYSVGAPS